MKNIIFIKDFLIAQNISPNINFNRNYRKIEVSQNVILMYKESQKFSFNYIQPNVKKIELYWDNPFHPIFKYAANNRSIITPNYQHFFDLKLSLTSNPNNIIEFTLFNTPTGKATFHNEVERVFNINRIVIDGNEIKFEYADEQSSNKSLFGVFQKQVYRTVLETGSLKHGIFLSGGSESRINAAIAQHYGLQKEFITWGHPEDKEYRIAAEISKKLRTKHINIRPDVSKLPYREVLLKTGFLVNMQYAYRYSVVKQLFQIYGYNLVWTGWGDINGYPTMYQSSELFSDFYLGLYKGEKRFPKGWNIDWLYLYKFNDNPIIEKVNINPGSKTFFSLQKEVFAPYIFGQVLSVENTLGSVKAPWFHPNIYNAIRMEEAINPKIINSKKERTMWKNDLYYKIIEKYCPDLNHFKNSKGYYPWMVRKETGILGITLAYLLKKIESFKRYPSDSAEDKKFLKIELLKIVEDSIEIFEKNDILEIINRIDSWTGNEIFEIFKLIQIYWFFKFKSNE